MKVNDINQFVKQFIGSRESIGHRYASFDLCYDYFFKNKGQLITEKLMLSCCQLWAFLASWGMITRGNELQSEKSYSCLKDVITYINDHPEYYELKLSDAGYIDNVLSLYENIDKVLGLSQKNKKTLITKIILGVYSCCPAFDSRFCKTFNLSTQGKLTRKNLQVVIDFYNSNKEDIDVISIETLPFYKGSNYKPLIYTSAKIVDMYGFEKNSKINNYGTIQ